jgi:tetratricopeptide (TPR) repeat protein
MPSVHNGIGTWYYGKRRIHGYKGTCSFCQRVGDLQSYDTTLYFVVFFVPIIPLSHKRVLEQCPHCSRHRVMKLKDWEAAKARDVAKLMDKLQENPDDRETTLHALALASAYQDEALLGKLASALAHDRLDDAGIQAQLGASYAYFARLDEAEAAYHASLLAADNSEVRQQLALVLLKQQRPDDARPYLRHVIDNKAKDHAGLLYLLADGYQAQGRHQEALQVMDERDAAFPEYAGSKEWTKQRQTSQRYLHSGKKVKSPYLAQSGKAGYQEGSWTSRIPRLIPPVVALGLLSWYLGAAVWKGQARQVYLVNGSNKPYKVAVNGQERSLTPGAAVPVRVPEGDIAVDLHELEVVRDPVHCRVETNFFTRPFTSRTFVINPDKLAVLTREEAEYALTPAPPGRPEFLTGNVLYTFAGIDYEFTPFPQTLQVKKGQTLKKTRVAVEPITSTEERLNLVTHLLDEKEAKDYVQRFLEFEADDVVALYWLIGQLKDEGGLDYLRPGLAVRPVRVEWHRAYQNLMEKLHPDVDLRPTFQRLVAETQSQPDALYLLARVADLGEADKLLAQAAGAPSPSPHALNALGFRALAQGKFQDAVNWTEKAVRLAPRNPFITLEYRSALHAAGNYDRLLEELSREQQLLGRFSGAVVEQVRVYTLKGDKAQAQATIDNFMRSMQGAIPAASVAQVRARFEIVRCCAEHNAAGFLEQQTKLLESLVFETALLQGNLSKGSDILARREDDEAMLQRGLLYLAALKAGNQKLAQEQWPLLLAALGKAERHVRMLGDMLSGRQPVQAGLLRRLPIEPRQKRVLLAVAAKRNTDADKGLLDLARKLDFYGDATSLCLRKVLN